MKQKYYLILVISLIFTVVFTTSSFAYDTIGVQVTPYKFSQQNITGISWKADIYEFEYNDPSVWRLEFNSLRFKGAKGEMAAGAWIQNILHQYKEASCNVDSLPGGLELYFTSMDQNMVDNDSSNDIIIGLRLDSNPNSFPRFRRVYQNIDYSQIVGNNIYSNDEIIKPNQKNPPTIEWNFNRGSLVTDPAGNLHKNINCQWQQLSGDYREWHFSIKVNGKNYPVGTFFFPEDYGSYIQDSFPFILLQEHFGACNSKLSANKVRVEYYDFKIFTASSRRPINIPQWVVTYLIDPDCQNADLRYGVGTVVRNNKKRLFTSTGHKTDMGLIRELNYVFKGIDEPVKRSLLAKTGKAFGFEETAPSGAFGLAILVALIVAIYFLIKGERKFEKTIKTGKTAKRRNNI